MQNCLIYDTIRIDLCRIDMSISNEFLASTLPFVFYVLYFRIEYMAIRNLKNMLTL